MTEHYYSEHPTSHLQKGLLRCRLRGTLYEFLTASSVFSHKRIDSGTRLLIESMKLPVRGSLLDLGCGYGPIGIVAAKLNKELQIWMTDINQRALTLAKKNAQRNKVAVQIIKGHLYEPVKNLCFDLILTNPPISAGIRKVVEPIIKGSIKHLNPKGSLQMVVRKSKGGQILSTLLERHYGGYKILAKKGGYRVLKADYN